ncbi:tryptophan dimethylallyltransferase-domain-containing protein [Leptodontidium sp. 2 PMI_412]|nr:tryptophan dimethylallyltransferase-domain-containing protein [Leptodontidium sp. 2 PMI_412]
MPSVAENGVVAPLPTKSLVLGTSQEKLGIKVWNSLVNTLPAPANKDTKFWWGITGYYLAVMIDQAGYSIERQYEVLLFHYQWIVPRLGPAPHPDGSPAFKALIAYDGSPSEYSWKWNTSKGEPDIRYLWEAIGPKAGKAANPLNHDPSLGYMEKVTHALPNANFSLYRYFLAQLYDPDRTYNKKKSFGLKSYFLPRKLFLGGDPATMQEWDAAIRKLNPDGKHPGRDALITFLATSREGRLMKPNVMGMDNVEPDKSRLKMYFTSAHTSFKSVREIMTMDGIRDISEESLLDFHDSNCLGAPRGLP